MNVRVVSLAVTVVSLGSYHLTQKSLPGGIRPAPLFAFVYGAASLGLIGVTVFGGADMGELSDVARAASSWTPWLLVLSVVGIELGYFFMYRSGWSISSGSLTVQAIVAALLVGVGVLRFGEHLTAGRGVGLVLCIAGAALVAH